MARNNLNNDGILITCSIKIHVKIQLRLKKWATNSVTLLLVHTGTYKVILLQDSVFSHGQKQCPEKQRRENLEPTREHSADQEAQKRREKETCDRTHRKQEASVKPDRLANTSIYKETTSENKSCQT